MITAVAITIDGILRKPIGGQLIEPGRRLFDALKDRYNVVLLSDAEDKEPEERWLLENHISGHGKLTLRTRATMGATAAGARSHQAISLRGNHYALDLIYEPDPQVAARLIEDGFNVAMIVNSAFTEPSWRPGHNVHPTPWEELEQRVSDNNKLWFMKKLEESE
jgi:hypothetical protein